MDSELSYTYLGKYVINFIKLRKMADHKITIVAHGASCAIVNTLSVQFSNSFKSILLINPLIFEETGEPLILK